MELRKRKKTGGRQKGTPNKATVAAREALAGFIDGNTYRLQEWLDRIARKDPKAAFRAYVSVLEFHLPKHQRIEATTKDGDIVVELRQFQRSVQWADGTPLYPHPLNRDRSGDG